MWCNFFNLFLPPLISPFVVKSSVNFLVQRWEVRCRPIAANIFMEALEQQAIATAPMDCMPKLWLCYVDDILEIVNKDCVEKLTDHINKVDKSGSIKFTYEKESEGKVPFLDTLIVKKEDGSVKLLVYRKPTHTDQYLNYESHHPLHHKLGVQYQAFIR